MSVPASETSGAGKLPPARCCCLKAPANARCLPVLLSYYLVYVRDQVPVVLGNDKPLFEGIHDNHHLKLLKTKAFRSGNVLLSIPIPTKKSLSCRKARSHLSSELIKAKTEQETCNSYPTLLTTMSLCFIAFLLAFCLCKKVA